MTSKECKFIFTEKDKYGVIRYYCSWLSVKRKKKECLERGCLHFMAKLEKEKNNLST